MVDMADAIMDAAERRIRTSGFNGFSFREIAADVGIKSSSVHYHFPTKELLAASVLRRYIARVSETIDQEFSKDPEPIRVWTKALRENLKLPGRMCPGTVLGASVSSLPPEVAAEVRNFFTMCLDKLVAQGLERSQASEFYSTLTGALILANALGDPSAYDRSTAERARVREAVGA